jgi:hypothetical protein
MTAAAMLSRGSRRWGDRDDDDGEEGGGGGGGRQRRDNDDVCPSSSCYYRPFSSSVDSPAPSLPGVAGGVGGRVAATATMTRTTWRCCTGGGWTSATPTPTAPMRWRGVVIDKLIPLLFSVDNIFFTMIAHGFNPDVAKNLFYIRLALWMCFL